SDRGQLFRGSEGHYEGRAPRERLGNEALRARTVHPSSCKQLLSLSGRASVWTPPLPALHFPPWVLLPIATTKKTRWWQPTSSGCKPGGGNEAAICSRIRLEAAAASCSWCPLLMAARL